VEGGERLPGRVAVREQRAERAASRNRLRGRGNVGHERPAVVWRADRSAQRHDRSGVDLELARREQDRL